MKHLLTFGLLIVLFNACKQTSKKNEEKVGDTNTEKKVTDRNLSITTANSYNDLFLDSNSVAAYLDTMQASDKQKRRFLSFYNARNYQYAWFASDGLTEQARGFYNLYLFDSRHRSDSLTRDQNLKQKMDGLFAEEDLKVSAADQLFLQTELRLTRLFIEHGLEMYEKGYVKRKEMERFIPSKKVEEIYLADSLINKKHKDNKYFEDINEPYKKLKNSLAVYVQIAKTGGWPVVNYKGKVLKTGSSDPAVITLKKRLSLSGDMAADTLPTFDQVLENGVKNFQIRYGYTPTGVVTQSLLKDINIPVEEKIEQLIVNLNRMRWMPSLPEGKMILVNIPEFVLHVKDGGKKVWDMNVVVGKEGHTTMMFTDELTNIVFSPYWNIPESIVRKEIMPKIASDPAYIARQNMEVVSNGSLPVIRQLPGKDNSLGKVKFLFPNSFNIYFHDTPAKSLFGKDARAYSHGCIRLAEPKKLAEYLLQDQPEWDTVSIDSAMNQDHEQNVKLKKAIPVFITYYTAWVDDNGRLNFREDIYGHDKAIKEKMFVKN